MIAIAAHTEPVVSSNPYLDVSRPPETVSSNQSVNESQHTHEAEESEKQSESFAEILAGLLNTTNVDSSEIQFTDDVSSDDFDLSIENILKNDLNIDLSNIGLLETFDFNIGSDIGAQEQPESNGSLIAGKFENNLTNFLSFDEEGVELPQEFSAEDLTANVKPDSAKENEMSDLAKEFAQKKTSGSELSKQGTEEALAAETAADKKRVTTEGSSENLSKQEKTSEDLSSIISSIRNAGKEDKHGGSESSRNKNEENSYEDGKLLSGGKLDEMRKLSRRERVAFEIRDQRTMVDVSQTRTFMTAEASATRVTDPMSVHEMTLELRLPEFNNAGQAAQSTWEVKAQSAMENMLARELHNNLNGDIVRHASMALRDGGESTIRLALRPDNLGNVKIRLEMADNKITGYIQVESEEALNAFKKEIASLEELFKESGFADANLDLSLSDNGSNSRREEDAFTAGIAASGYEESLRDSTETVIEAFVSYGDTTGYVNMMA